MKRIILSYVVILVFAAQIASSQIPQTMSYQGLLTSPSGKPVPDGNYNLTFRLYATEVAGAVIWTETHTSVTVVKGIFNVILGGATPPTLLALPFDQQYWLGITVGAGPELSPRIKLTSSAYSLNSRTVADGAVTTIKLADNAVTAAKIQPNVVSSVDGVINDGGNIDLVPGANIAITPDDGANNITIAASDVWKLTGNSGTTAANFLGTTDSKALELRVNGVRALKLEPNSTSANFIGGYSGNSATSGVVGATIGGGGKASGIIGISYKNLVTDDFGTIGGGADNQAGDGAGATDESVYATVGGGWNNKAKSSYATVGGGDSNEATTYAATVSGGQDNKASMNWATIGGGTNNIASGVNSTVPGGRNNTAQGIYSFSAGYRAKALHNGAFVWGDSYEMDLNSLRPNHFMVRCTGGAWFISGIDIDDVVSFAGVVLNPGSSAWSPGCSRSIKDNFAPVDGRDILKRLVSVPIETWNYKTQDSSIRHIGLMSQDFYDTFGLGEDDEHISTVDADGVALAAIQGLYELVKEKDAKIAELEARLAALESRVK